MEAREVGEARERLQSDVVLYILASRQLVFARESKIAHSTSASFAFV